MISLTYIITFLMIRPAIVPKMENIDWLVEGCWKIFIINNRFYWVLHYFQHPNKNVINLTISQN
jgi:hypothetical protein